MPTSVQCVSCKHYKRSLTCSAYPERIPPAIVTGKVAHRQVLPDQVGDAVFDIRPELIEFFPEAAKPTVSVR